MKLFNFLKREPAKKKCFFEKDRTCDRECKAYTEKGTCSIVGKLKEKADAGECAALLKELCDIDCDMARLHEKFPDLVPPPKLVYEE